jgi:ABC-type glycerol-3-phosphate transport system permease component
VTSSRDLYTVTQGLAVTGRASGIHVGVVLTTAVMAILPVIIVLPVLAAPYHPWHRIDRDQGIATPCLV